MEQKLKKQRNKLLFRITLIMLAVWLSVSVIFCVIRLSAEKVNVQSNELSDLSYVKHLLTVSNGDFDSVNRAFIEYTNIVYSDDGTDNRFDMQIVITDRKTNHIIADTAKTIGVRYSIKQGDNTMQYVVCLLNFDAIRNALNDKQIQTISDYLNTNRADGDYYDLVCTKFHLRNVAVIPLELKIILVDGNDTRLTVNDNVCTFELNDNLIQGYPVCESSTITRNLIPKDFLLKCDYNKDYIGSLTKKQRNNSTDMIPTGTFEYLFYAKDYLNYDNSLYNEADDAWLIEYVKKINLLENCKSDLIIGVALAFGFFLTIAVILWVMIWKTIKTQIVQEQKRLDLTNALAHDIKTPLFVISGYAYSLKENIDEAERELYLDKIIEQTDEVNNLIHRIINFSKLDSYKMVPYKTEFDLCELTQEILKNYSALSDHKKVVLSHSGKSRITADRELIKTALQNLIDNAVKYSLPDSEIQIEITDHTFTINNQTEAMTKGEIKNLWKPYVRKDESRHKKGNGLGLSIVKSILDLHDAKYHMNVKDKTLTCQITFS